MSRLQVEDKKKQSDLIKCDKDQSMIQDALESSDMLLLKIQIYN